jgi:hypothetical protein
MIWASLGSGTVYYFCVLWKTCSSTLITMLPERLERKGFI